MLIYQGKVLLMGIINRNLPAAIPIMRSSMKTNSKKITVRLAHHRSIQCSHENFTVRIELRAHEILDNFRGCISYRFAAVCCCTDDSIPEVVPQCARLTLIGIVRFRSGGSNICAPCSLSVDELIS